MSSNNNNHNNKRQQQNRIECPVCRAAGKSELGHYIRNDKGKTICPTLLEQSCRHCGQKGHTPKYCVQKKNEERRSSYQTPVRTTTAVVQANPFHQFEEEEEEDEVEEGEIREVETVNTKKTREELRIMLCELLGMKTHRQQQQQVTKRRMLWSEMEDSEDEE
jgi:hypothetical protein